MLTLWRRHRTTCPHKADRYYRKCRCAVHCEGTVESTYIRRSLKTRSWERGEILKRQLEDGTTPKEQPKSITIKDALDAFIADCEARNLNPATGRKYRLLRDRLSTFCTEKHLSHLSELQTDTLRHFRGSRTLSPRTASKELERLRAFFKFCVENEWLTKNPAKSIKAPQVKVIPRIPFSEQEIQNILSKAQDDKELAFLLTLRHTGLRIGDASLLRTSQYQSEQCRIHLYTTKSGTPVSILIPETLSSLLKQIPPKGGYFFLRGESTHAHTTSDLWRKRIKVICSDLKIVPGHPHRFRHSLACSLLSQGVSVENVAAILGNSPAIVAKHYSQFVKQRQDALDLAIQKTWEKQRGLHIVASSE